MTARKTPLPPPPNWAWQERARCRGEDLTLFFGADGERAHERGFREERAKRICRLCPVAAACLAYAIDKPEVAGVWGAMGEDERVAERRRQMRRANAA